VREQAKLISAKTHTLWLPNESAKTMALKTGEVIKAPPPSPLKLEGTLFLDPNRLTRVHTRFAGEVVEIGKINGMPDARDDDGRAVERSIRFGDQVEKGQLLAVVWCKDLGEKKAELVDCMSRMFLDQETKQRLGELYEKGAIPERSLREAERNVESDMIAVSRAESTLRVWRLTNADLEEIRSEAVRIHKNKGQWDEDVRGQWARVEVRASITGTVVEKNIAVGDIVDTSLDLYKIADLTRLDVLAHAYEEDIPQLEDLPHDERHWNIFLKSNPDTKPLSGSFSQIGNIIDPNQHTALIMGWVDNSNGRLRIGQFVTAEVDLPRDPNEVAVPSSALVDQDATTYIFVQPKQGELQFSRRKVLLVRRRDNLAYLMSNLADKQAEAGYQSVTAGEQVVVSGSLELASQLDTLEADARVAQK
jgi:cobalt-zinc-cadmium efflux system membrane fusion protein